MNTLVIPAVYFGPVELYRAILKAERVIVDGEEHFVKQSYRTRTDLVGANGVEHMVQRIQRTHRKTPMREMQMSNVEKWREEHWHTVRSCYGQSPWFIHFEKEVSELILEEEKGLFDRNLAIMGRMLDFLGYESELEISSEYVENPEWTDLRSTLHPKKPLPEGNGQVGPYRQTFAARHGFVPRMSILDLLMNMGPQAKSVLLD